MYVLSTGTAYARARKDAGCGGSRSKPAKYINMEWNQVHLFNEGKKEFARQPQVCVYVCVCVCGASKMNDACGSSPCCTNTHLHTACLHLVAGLNTRRAKSQNVCAFVLATPTELVCCMWCVWPVGVCMVSTVSVCVCAGHKRWARVQCATFQLMNGQLEKKPPSAAA